MRLGGSGRQGTGERFGWEFEECIIDWVTGSLDHWVTGSLGHWITGSLGHWVTGSLGHGTTLQRWVGTEESGPKAQGPRSRGGVGSKVKGSGYRIQGLELRFRI